MEQLVLVLLKCLCLLAFIFLHVTLNIRMVYRLVSKQRNKDGNFLIGVINLVVLLRWKMLRRGAVMDGVVQMVEIASKGLENSMETLDF